MIAKTISLLSPAASALSSCFLARADEMKEARQMSIRYRAVIELCPVATFISLPNGKCDYVNPAYELLVGAKLHELIGDGWQNFIHPEDQPRALQAWEEALRSKTPYACALRVLPTNGEPLDVRIIARELPCKSWVGYYVPLEDRPEIKLVPHKVA